MAREVLTLQNNDNTMKTRDFLRVRKQNQEDFSNYLDAEYQDPHCFAYAKLYWMDTDWNHCDSKLHYVVGKKWILFVPDPCLQNPKKTSYS